MQDVHFNKISRYHYVSFKMALKGFWDMMQSCLNPASYLQESLLCHRQVKYSSSFSTNFTLV